MTKRKDGVICGAKTRAEDNHPCLRPPTAGRERCYLHGGGVKRGIEHHNWKGSTRRADRISAALPRRLGERFQLAKSDPELLQLESDVALVDTRLEELLQLVDSGESGQLWARVQGAFTAFCIHRGTERGPAAFDALEAAIEAGASDRERWAEVAGLLDQRRKLVESERKRQVEMKLVMSMESVSTFFATVGAAVRRHVSDEETLRAIDAEFRVLVNLPELPDGESI